MAKKIKKQIIRSMPLFVIFSLLTSSVAVGLVFNFDLGIYKTFNEENAHLALTMPEAHADDTATTTVQVQNAPPIFLSGTYPYEDPSSTSTSPINNTTGTMTFKAYGDDPENHEYFLAVCETNAVTAHNYNPPTCDAGTFCISASTTDTQLATCTTAALTIAAETDEWYAFVCDGHATDAACNSYSASYSQGIGPGDVASSSPFYINHAPTISTTSATINHKEVGETFEFTATSSDSDITRAGDMIHVYICATSSFSIVTWSCGQGSGAELCHGSSTPNGAAATSTVCTWSPSSPTADATYTYYTYIFGEFYLEGTNNPATSTYTIINSPPTIAEYKVVLQPTTGNNVVLNLKGAAEVVVTASTTKNEVFDKNGCTDLEDATSTIYWESAIGGYACAADNDDCYLITDAFCVINDCDGPTDDSATIVCSTTMAFHAMPTDTSSWHASNTVWKAAIFPYDEAATGVGSSSPGTDVQTGLALEVQQSGIDYGTIIAGQNSGSTNSTTTVENYGNCPIDTQLEGEDMDSGGDTITMDQQEHHLSPFTWGTAVGTKATTTPDWTIEDTIIDRPEDDADTKTDNILWGIGVPGSAPSGIYTGTTTFIVVIDDDGVWD